MPDPITRTNPTANGYYDEEAGVCRSDPSTATPAQSSSGSSRASSGSARSGSEGEPVPSQAAVDRLVAKRLAQQDSNKCNRSALMAGSVCAGTVAAALSGVGAVAAFSGAVGCGAALAEAEANCQPK